MAKIVMKLDMCMVLPKRALQWRKSRRFTCCLPFTFRLFGIGLSLKNQTCQLQIIKRQPAAFRLQEALLERQLKCPIPAMGHHKPITTKTQSKRLYLQWIQIWRYLQQPQRQHHHQRPPPPPLPAPKLSQTKVRKNLFSRRIPWVAEQKSTITLWTNHGRTCSFKDFPLQHRSRKFRQKFWRM